MSKRSNEHGQLRKEEYDAMFSSKESSTGRESFSKASIGEMKKRRLVKASRTPSQPASETKATTPDENKKSSNPFASVSFGAGSSGSVPFSFSSNSNKYSDATNLFSFGSNNRSSKAEPSVLSKQPANADKEKEERLRKLNSAFRTKNREQGNKIHHLPRDIDLYLRYHRLICLNTRSAASIQSSATTESVADKPSVSSTEASSSTTVKASGGFSFGSTTSSDKKSVTSSFATSQSQPSATFSFGNSTTSSVTGKDDTTQSSAKVSFSHDANSSATSTDAPATTEESGKADPDWETDYKVEMVKPYVYENDGWTSFSKGNLQVQLKKSDNSKKRVVVRDSIGKVLLNIMITNLQFTGRKKNNKAYIIFHALRDQTKGMEQMMLQCFPAEYDGLLAKLQAMSAP